MCLVCLHSKVADRLRVWDAPGDWQVGRENRNLLVEVRSLEERNMALVQMVHTEEDARKRLQLRLDACQDDLDAVKSVCPHHLFLLPRHMTCTASNRVPCGSVVQGFGFSRFLPRALMLLALPPCQIRFSVRAHTERNLPAKRWNVLSLVGGVGVNTAWKEQEQETQKGTPSESTRLSPAAKDVETRVLRAQLESDAVLNKWRQRINGRQHAAERTSEAHAAVGAAVLHMKARNQKASQT